MTRNTFLFRLLMGIFLALIFGAVVTGNDDSILYICGVFCVLFTAIGYWIKKSNKMKEWMLTPIKKGN